VIEALGYQHLNHSPSSLVHTLSFVSFKVVAAKSDSINPKDIGYYLILG
jgi:hypothetical protein